MSTWHRGCIGEPDRMAGIFYSKLTCATASVSVSVRGVLRLTYCSINYSRIFQYVELPFAAGIVAFKATCLRTARTFHKTPIFEGNIRLMFLRQIILIEARPLFSLLSIYLIDFEHRLHEISFEFIRVNCLRRRYALAVSSPRRK